MIPITLVGYIEKCEPIEKGTANILHIRQKGHPKQVYKVFSPNANTKNCIMREGLVIECACQLTGHAPYGNQIFIQWAHVARNYKTLEWLNEENKEEEDD